MRKAIIPAAGLGTRMGMAPHESKEMLPDDSGLPMILWSIQLALQHGFEPLILVRKEKQKLMEFLDLLRVSYLIVSDCTGEWAHTVLQSEHLWDQDCNLLLLPDTRWDRPSATIKSALRKFRSAPTVYGCHPVDDISKWGMAEGGAMEEKPRVQRAGWAWGFLMFDWKSGLMMFDAFRQRRPITLLDYEYVLLNNFKDITREGRR